jgi:hypothetical protein
MARALCVLLSLVAVANASNTTAEHVASLRLQFKACTDKLPGHISSWSKFDLGVCLELCHLPKNITETFMNHSIDGDSFFTVTENDLVKLDVSRVDVARFRMMVCMLSSRRARFRRMHGFS